MARGDHGVEALAGAQVEHARGVVAHGECAEHAGGHADAQHVIGAEGVAGLAGFEVAEGQEFADGDDGGLAAEQVAGFVDEHAAGAEVVEGEGRDGAGEGVGVDGDVEEEDSGEGVPGEFGVGGGDGGVTVDGFAAERADGVEMAAGVAAVGENGLEGGEGVHGRGEDTRESRGSKTQPPPCGAERRRVMTGKKAGEGT